MPRPWPIYKQLAADFPDRPEFRRALAGTHSNLGNSLHDAGRLKEAEAAHAEGLAIRRQLVADFPARYESLPRGPGLEPQQHRLRIPDDRAAEGSDGGLRRVHGHLQATRRRLPRPARIPPGTGQEPQ